MVKTRKPTQNVFNKFYRGIKLPRKKKKSVKSYMRTGGRMLIIDETPKIDIGAISELMQTVRRTNGTIHLDKTLH